MNSQFLHRSDAGRQLAERLTDCGLAPDTVVLALPRGGVPVGFEIAESLHATLDVFVVRKLGVPGYPELAMGAIASGGRRVLNQQILSDLRISTYVLESVEREQKKELERREIAYRGALGHASAHGKTIVVVDDGVATGATLLAAIAVLKREKPARLIAAVPVAAPDALYDIAREVDEAVCLLTPAEFNSVGEWYEEFPQIGDEEVRHLLRDAQVARPLAGAS